MTAASVRHPSLDITDEQEANLRKLAAYLTTLPVDYADFEMSLYSDDYDDDAHVVCGTAACAVGHGPAAGVEPQGSEWWDVYSFRAFLPARASGAATSAWQWCFSADWWRIDNTAHGAAKRILWLLEHGVPDNDQSQRLGVAPLCYAVQS